MSDTGFDRVAIADGITADLQAMDKEDTTPPPAAEVQATPEEVAPAPETVTPAPEPEQQAQEPKQLADTDLVVDPLDGAVKKWGEVKAERLRHADYTKKTMAVAEERKAFEAQKAQFAADQQMAQIKAQRAALPQLPEDDPYAQTIRAQQDQLEALAKYQALMQEQMQQAVADRELAASKVALDALEKQITTDFKLSAKDTDRVLREYYVRSQTGEQISPLDVAKERRAEIDALKAEGEKEFKERHRVASPAAAASTPGAAAKETDLVPGTRGFRDRMREEIAALMS